MVCLYFCLLDLDMDNLSTQSSTTTTYFFRSVIHTRHTRGNIPQTCLLFLYYVTNPMYASVILMFLFVYLLIILLPMELLPIHVSK